jgi:UDP-N-acetylmuramyl pentapeptide phosphotransferase/UDP-N-acetylglucosamine-1-phosphate transferase
MSDTGDVILGLGAFAVSVLVTPLAAQLARMAGLVDHPGPLKPHEKATPYLGGIGVAGGAALGAAYFRPWVLVPLAMALGLGTADDVRPLPPVIRLVTELATGVVVAVTVWTRFSGASGFILVALATVVLMNGINLLDGLDGLCGSVTLLSAVGFAVILTGDARYLAVALAGATAAFLIFNLPPAKVYLGDGGTYLIGTSIAVLLAVAWGPSEALHTGIGALALVVVPVAELAFAVLRRARSGRSLLLGDRDHPYDQLVKRGWSPRRAAASYGLAALVMAALATLTNVLSTTTAAIVVGSAVVVVFVIGLEAGFMTPDLPEPTDNLHP